MHLRLSARTPRTGCVITLNYSYYLSTAIYRWIEASSPGYSRFLHDKGFQVNGSLKRFKHFCFSQLGIARRRINNGMLQILSPTIEWYITMPVEASLQHLVVGIFENREFYIEREENRFVVEQVETLPDPRWERRMRFRLLSPLSSSVTVEKNGKLMPYYLLAGDPRLNEALRINLLNKFRSLYDREPEDTELVCTLDNEFIAGRGGSEKISKLITIKQGRPDETRVRGFMCPLTLDGNPELIALAYESGLGEKNSLGFGMLETA